MHASDHGRRSRVSTTPQQRFWGRKDLPLPEGHGLVPQFTMLSGAYDGGSSLCVHDIVWAYERHSRVGIYQDETLTQDGPAFKLQNLIPRGTLDV